MHKNFIYKVTMGAARGLSYIPFFTMSIAIDQEPSSDLNLLQDIMRENYFDVLLPSPIQVYQKYNWFKPQHHYPICC